MNINMKTELNMNMKTKTEMPKIVPAKKLRGCGGFTIVELVVSAVIMLIAVIAIVAVVRKSTDMQVTDNYRRQARAAIMRQFETRFDRYNSTGSYKTEFVGVDDDGNENPDDQFLVVVGAGFKDFPSAIVGINRTVYPPDTLTGTLSYRATSGNIDIAIDGDDTKKTIPYHDITIRVKWQDVNGPDSIELTKRLADIYDK